MSALDDLRGAVARAATSLGATPKAPPTLERARQAEHGDYATNAAMLLAGGLRRNPREVAQELSGAVAAQLGDDLVRAEVAGPGFLNLFLSDGWHGRALAGVLEAGEAHGAGSSARRLKVNVEFVSANPTGPLHVGGTRNAAYGDALARLLAFAGHDVHREFYVNDFGTQVRVLGASVIARARGEELPEDGYRGDYVAELADRLPEAAADGADLDEVAARAVALMMEGVRASLASLRVEMDTWSSERSLHEARDGQPSRVEHAFEVLERQGRTYRHDGALWLRTTEFGDDKDRVLERSTGDHTYFASDIAYHQDKRERGFDLLIDVWGADHHGYVRRMHAAYEALGGRAQDLELLIMQLVHLVEGGQRTQMSKRAGEFVTLDDLVGEIGADAARWFLLARSHDTTMDLDLDLARSQSSENPVYYVQYAHARIASIRRKAGAEPAVDARTELHVSERALVQALLAFGPEAAEAAERRAPHRMTTYVLALAQAFTAFYRDCPIVGAPEEANRLALAVATQRTLARGLDLMGIEAPEEM